jgi:hypothetical protein
MESVRRARTALTAAATVPGALTTVKGLCEHLSAIAEAKACE